MPVIPPLRRLKQENFKFEASQDYIASASPQKDLYFLLGMWSQIPQNKLPPHPHRIVITVTLFWTSIIFINIVLHRKEW